MKNLLNCHCIGLHSFPIKVTEEGLYKRIFYAAQNHEMWKPYEIAIHPHHVDIKITVLEGELLNPLFEVDTNGEIFKKFRWNSHILNDRGGFEYLGEAGLRQISNIKHRKGDVVEMKACELHTVQIEYGKVCVWLIEESKPTCEYFPINYSKNNLQDWKPDGLYIECDEETKENYISNFLQYIQ
jgi:hypothetical protein